MPLFVDGDRLLADVDAFRRCVANRNCPVGGGGPVLDGGGACSDDALARKYAACCRPVLRGVRSLQALRKLFPNVAVYVLTESPEIFLAAVGCDGICSSGCVCTPCICSWLNVDNGHAESSEELISDATRHGRCRNERKLRQVTKTRGALTYYMVASGGPNETAGKNVLLTTSASFADDFSSVFPDAVAITTNESKPPATWDDFFNVDRGCLDRIAAALEVCVSPKGKSYIQAGDDEATWPKLVSPLQPLQDTPEGMLWKRYRLLEEPVNYCGHVARGQNRGGRMLGCPTANINCPVPIGSRAGLPLPGIYVGLARLRSKSLNEKCVPTVLSAGFNPYFDNQHFTVECHMLKSFEEDFYGAAIALTVVAFLRPESSFGSLVHLVRGIQLDCDEANRLFMGFLEPAGIVARSETVLEGLAASPLFAEQAV